MRVLFDADGSPHFHFCIRQNSRVASVSNARAFYGRLGSGRAALLSGTAALVSLISFGSPAYSQGVSTEFTVGGQVIAPRTFTLPDLQALPATTLNVTFLAGSSSVTTTFTGPQMWTLLNSTVGLRLNSTVKNDVLRNVVVATGSDGYQVVYALGEINPSFGGSATRPELVAYAGSTSSQLLTTDGFARTVEPGDIR